MKIILENIRCFDGVKRIPIKPLTLLVGENSSGKSTFLSAISAISNQETFPFRTNFNQPPFELGSFDTIATYKGGKYGRAKDFSLGFESTDSKNRYQETKATYISDLGQPRLKKLYTKHYMGEASIEIFREKQKYFSLNAKFSENDFRFSYDKIYFQDDSELNNIAFLIYQTIMREERKREKENENEMKSGFSQYFSSLRAIFDNIFITKSIAIAPIRTKPKRTYDQIIDDFNPEGGHIPYLLAKIFIDQSLSDEKQILLESLENFGVESGLYNKIDVKQFGDKLSDPFQISAKIFRRFVNLLDVGYGVSQSLPIIVESIISKDKMLLLQQPEVHLHPRAQAALGTFFVNLLKNGAKNVIIETHSDFIIDRIRYEVSKGNINPDLVSILFFDRQEYETTFYALNLDLKGNILNAPPNYREFFLHEESNLLSR